MAKNMELPRRQFLAALGAAAGLKLRAQNQEDETGAYLRSLVRTRDWVAGFLNKKPMIAGYHANFGWVYDPDLGCRLVDSYRDDGLDGSRTYHTYERTGARTRVNFPNEQARIRTYGNSYTHCDQVNDGETWQEALAAHLGEPIKNHGVGGYSVYQAYLRMKKVERNHPAAYIILNVFDDDHFRNLDGFRSFRVRDPLEGTNPHVRVRVEKNQVEERPNVCARPEDVYKLTDVDWLLKTFAGDPVLLLEVAARRKPVTRQSVVEVARAFDISDVPERPKTDWESELRTVHVRAAIFATIKVLEMAETYAASAGKRLMVVLSYGPQNMKRHLQGESPFDQELLDYLQTRSYPFVDSREAHVAEFKTFRLDPETYLRRYYIGHYNPAGYSFFAMAMKNKIVDWLNPRPRTYSKGSMA